MPVSEQPFKSVDGAQTAMQLREQLLIDQGAILLGSKGGACLRFSGGPAFPERLQLALGREGIFCVGCGGLVSDSIPVWANLDAQLLSWFGWVRIEAGLNIHRPIPPNLR